MCINPQELILRPIAPSEKSMAVAGNSRSHDLISGVMTTTLPQHKCFTGSYYWVLASISIFFNFFLNFLAHYTCQFAFSVNDWIFRGSINTSTLIISGIPGTPLDLTVIEVTATSVALSWTPPHDRGGGNIIGYHVKYTVANTELTAKFKDSSIIVDDLEKDTTYKFKVAAENEAGVGPYSDEVEGTTIGEYDIV